MAPQGKQKMRWRKRQGRLLDQLQQEINAMIVDAVADAVADYPAGPSEEGFEEVLHLIREMQLQRHTDWQPSAEAVHDALHSFDEEDDPLCTEAVEDRLAAAVQDLHSFDEEDEDYGADAEE